MGGFEITKKLKDDHPLMQQKERLLKGQTSNPVGFDALSENAQMWETLRRAQMTQEELEEQLKQDEQLKQEALKEEWLELGKQLGAVQAQRDQEQFLYQRRELTKNKNDKELAKLKTPLEIEALREKRHQKAIEADKRKVFADKARHGFYKFVGAFVKAGRWMSGADKAEKETRENPEYEMPGLFAEYWRLENMRPDEADPEFEEKVKEFNEKYGSYYEMLKEQYEKKDKSAKKEATEKVAEAEKLLEKELTEKERADAIEKEKRRIMEAATFKMKFGDSQQSQVEGGTKPNAFQYAADGSKWLMKTNHSCIGAAAPNASIMTVAGYKVQKLVNPDTAIEAFESKSKGVGTVSLQRLVDGVVSKTDPAYVDLFRFSRTPEAMTEEELKKVESMAPQFLREYMTDFLLGNYDTKGENFLICKDADGKVVIRGIDKEAAGRKDLVPEAQHMQKDKHFFDQDTVYNQLFRKFADGSMTFDLNEAAQYIERIEQMSTEDYLKYYDAYFARQKQDRTKEEHEQIVKNVTYRKEYIRVEARRFFGELVKERMKMMPEEAEELKQKYLGGVDDGIFLFKGETAEQLRAEREMIAKKKEDDAKALKEKIQKADAADKKSYKRRHAVYDFAKAIIMGVKKKPGDDYIEKRTTKIKLDDQQFDTTDLDESMTLVVESKKKQYEQRKKNYEDRQFEVHRERLIEEYAKRSEPGFEGNLSEDELKRFVVDTFGEEIEKIARERAHEETVRYFAETTMDLKMVADQEIFLGGTKPMSQYVGSDGSKWLAKQAVTCVGTYKPSGAILTEIGSNIQKMVDKETAVEAFVGQTKKHGMVSFQRKLKNVVDHDVLDLFKFSKHPELATQATTKQVEELMPQILREHVTDWLLCNFDTKGENFVLTQEEGKPMVLHGIDKEAAFNKILDPDAWRMSTTYKPHANNTLYNVVFEKFANAEMDFDLKAVIPYVNQMVDQVTEDEYKAKYQSYFDYLHQKAGTKEKDIAKANQIERIILNRRKTLKADYIEFFNTLIERRCKHLHPDEATALRNRYYGEGGTSFRFD